MMWCLSVPIYLGALAVWARSRPNFHVLIDSWPDKTTSDEMLGSPYSRMRKTMESFGNYFTKSYRYKRSGDPSRVVAEKKWCTHVETIRSDLQGRCLRIGQQALQIQDQFAVP